MTLTSNKFLDFLSLLEAIDQAWLMSIGREDTLLASQTLCNTGDEVKEIYVVMEGMLHLYHVNPDGSQSLNANLGPGEMIGDVSWIANRPYTNTIIAFEQTLILAWSCSCIEQRLTNDSQFAKKYFHACAKRCADQLQCLEAAFNATQYNQHQIISPAQFPELNRRLCNFKALFARTDKLILRNDSLSVDDVPELQNEFRSFSDYLNSLLGNESKLDPLAIEEIGRAVQYEVLPLIMLSDNADRFYSKPRGYAGDYQSIAQIYDNQPQGKGRMGAFIDACWLSEPAAQAVRNRRPLMKNIIKQVIETNLPGPVQITSMACGPAAEIFDVYEDLEDKAVLQCQLIDIDLLALAYVEDLRDQRKLGTQIHLHNSNLIYLATGRKKLKVPPQHLVYSVGLIDYFSDKFVLALIDFTFDILCAGGRLVLGNFHPRNPTRAVMDHVLEWRLIHRTEEDMHHLLASSKFGKEADAIHFEPLGVNLFAECVKP